MKAEKCKFHSDSVEYLDYVLSPSGLTMSDAVTPQMNFPQKITFDTLYTNEFLIRIRSRALSIPSERNTI